MIEFLDTVITYVDAAGAWLAGAAVQANDILFALVDSRFGWWILGVVMGLAIGLTFGVLMMASLRLSARSDEEIDTMLDHGGYEAAGPFVVRHDFTGGRRIV